MDPARGPEGIADVAEQVIATSVHLAPVAEDTLVAPEGPAAF